MAGQDTEHGDRMVKKVKVPVMAELFKMDRMDLLKIIKQLRGEIEGLRTTIRAKNVTIREERIRKREHWAKLKRYRQAVGQLKDVETHKT